MTNVDNLDNLAAKISAASTNIRKYAVAQAAVTQAQELEIRKLAEEVAVLKGSGTGPRPGPLPDPDPPGPPVEPPATSTYGNLLPARIPVSTGSVINVTTVGQLQTQMASCAFGSIIDGGGNTFNVGGAINLTWNRNGAGVVTTLRNCVFASTRVLVLSPGKWFRLEDCTFTDSPYNAVKLEGGQYVDVDSVTSTRVLDTNGGSGFIATPLASVMPSNYQVWNSTWVDCGYNATVASFGHGLYCSRFDANCVIANNVVINCNAFGIQVYPGRATGDSGLIVTGLTVTGSDNRGAIVCWGDPVDNTNCKFVGIVEVNAATNMVECWDALSANNRLYGGVAYNAAGSHYQLANLAPVNLVTTNPLLDANGRPTSNASAAKDLVPASMYGYLPATDRDGLARVTADAGAFRVPA